MLCQISRYCVKYGIFTKIFKMMLQEHYGFPFHRPPICNQPPVRKMSQQPTDPPKMNSGAESRLTYLYGPLGVQGIMYRKILKNANLRRKRSYCISNFHGKVENVPGNYQPSQGAFSLYFNRTSCFVYKLNRPVQCKGQSCLSYAERKLINIRNIA